LGSRDLAYRPCLDVLEDRLAPATHIWTGPTGGLWSNPANWNGGVPTTGEAGGTLVEFDGNSDSTDDIANLAIGHIYTTGGNNTLRGTTPLGFDGSSQYLGGSIGGSGDITLDASLPIVLSGGLFEVTENQVTIEGNISGDQPVELLSYGGTALLVLSGTNSYSGSTFIEEGILRVGSARALPSGSVMYVSNFDDAILDMNNFDATIGSLATLGPPNGGHVMLGSGTLTVGGDNTSTTFSGSISGTGGLTKQGSGIFTLTGANAYSGPTTINAGTLRLGNANALPSASDVVLADVAGAILDLNSFNATTIGTLSGGGTLGGNVALGSGTLTVGAGYNTPRTFSGIISGTGGLTLQVSSGYSPFTLGGANSYSGPTIINAGELRVGTGGTNGLLGTGPIVNNSILSFSRSDTFTVANVISGSGTLIQAGSGTLILTGPNSYSGGWQVGTGTATGTLRVGNANAIPPTTTVDLSGGGVFDLNNLDVTIGMLFSFVPFSSTGIGTVALGSGTLTTSGDNPTVFGGVITGTGGLIKQGNHTLTLYGDNLYSGATIISAGTLEVGRAGTSGSLGTGAVTNYGNLTFNRSDTISVANSISGSGTVTQSGSGTLLLTGANSYSGPTTVLAGRLRVGAAHALPSASAVVLANAAGVSLDLNNFSLTVGSLAGGGSNGGNVTMGSGTLSAGADNTSTTFSGVISGSGGFTKVGSGTLILANVNTYTGTTTITTGKLQAGVPNAIPATSPLTNNDGLVFSSTQTLTVANPISGSGTLTQAGGGTLILTGPNSYSGGTVISAGTVLIDNDNELGAASSALTLSGGTLRSMTNNISSNRTLTVTAASVLDIAPGTTVTLGGTIGGTGNLTKTNTGNLTLAGNGSYTGTITFADGVLLVTGNQPSASVIVNRTSVVAGTGAIGTLSDPGGAILRPGPSPAAGNGPGQLSTGPNTNLRDFIYEADVTGSAAGQHDTLRVAGNANLGSATLTLNVSSGFPSSLNPDTPFTLVSAAGSLSGTFAGLADNATLTEVVKGTPLTFRINYTGNAATLTYIPIEITLALTPIGVGSPAGTPAGTLSTTTQLVGQLVLPIFSLPSGAAPDNALFSAGQTGTDGTAVLLTAAPVNRLSYTILVQADTGLGIVQRTFTFTADPPPLTVVVNRAAGQDATAGADPAVFLVVFSQPVNDFTSGDVAVAGTAGPTTAAVTGSGTAYTVAVSGMTRSGTVSAVVAAGVAHDGFGTPNQAGTGGDATVNYIAPPPPLAQRVYDAATDFTHSREHYTQFVAGAYQRYLHRAPDATGLEAWVSGLLNGAYTDEQIEAQFIGSVEYILNHGGTGQAWVIGMYKDLLGRTPSDAEVTNWVITIAAGTPSAAVAYGFAASRERSEQRVHDNYQTYLGRPATPGEVDLWSNGFLNGVTSESMVAGFVGSPEYYQSSQKGQDDRATWVHRAYVDILGRDATDDEVKLWMQFLA
jgi:autotransporter-associated beta strand protein